MVSCYYRNRLGERCMKKIFAISFIIIGILLLLAPTLKDKYLASKVTATVESIKEVTPEKIKENEQSVEAEFDYSIVEDISVTGTLLNSSKVNKDLIVGQLVIPSVKMNITIFKGINNTNLLAGAATMRADQKMGIGNYPLAGHYTTTEDLLFGSLMKVKVGDLIRLTDKETIYEYKTYEVKVVQEDAIYIIEDQYSMDRGKPIISLMTCYYSSKTGKRYFVLGELVNSYPYTEDLLFQD